MRKARGVCRNFQAGKCKFGENCIYQHVKTKPGAESNNAELEKADTKNKNNNAEFHAEADADNAGLHV